MIKVVCGIDSLSIEGHSGYSEHGNDIVCASVSTAINVTANAILRIDNNAIKYEDNGKKVVIKYISLNDITKSLIDNLIAVLLDLSNQYPQNIKIEMEEEK